MNHSRTIPGICATCWAITRMPNVPDINDVQPQRGGKDCVIAAIATLVARLYDEVARGLGLPFRDGEWDMGDGVDASDAIYLLLSWGWIAAPLVSKECEKKHKWPEKIGRLANR